MNLLIQAILNAEKVFPWTVLLLSQGIWSLMFLSDIQGEVWKTNGIWRVSQEIDLIWRLKFQNHTNLWYRWKLVIGKLSKGSMFRDNPIHSAQMCRLVGKREPGKRLRLYGDMRKIQSSHKEKRGEFKWKSIKHRERPKKRS